MTRGDDLSDLNARQDNTKKPTFVVTSALARRHAAFASHRSYVARSCTWLADLWESVLHDLVFAGLQPWYVLAHGPRVV